MARYIGPVCRQCRREGMKLFLKGERCYTDKCAIEKRNVPPGQHGRARKAKMVGYGIQLREKQKVKRIYGVLENQFRRYFEAADRQKGITGELLLQMLERRLDNVIYRLGFATSRPQARQLVRHGHFTINGKPIDAAQIHDVTGNLKRLVLDGAGGIGVAATEALCRSAEPTTTSDIRRLLEGGVHTTPAPVFNEPAAAQGPGPGPWLPPRPRAGRRRPRCPGPGCGAPPR